MQCCLYPFVVAGRDDEQWLLYGGATMVATSQLIVGGDYWLTYVLTMLTDVLEIRPVTKAKVTKA